MRFVSFLAALVLAPTLVWANDAALQEIIDSHWAYTLEQDPLLATSLGVREYDGLLRDESLAAMDARKAKFEAFLTALEEIDSETLPPKAALNYRLLEQDLRTNVAALSYPQRAMIFTRFYGWHMRLASLPDRVPFFTLADYQSYIARLNAFPAQNAQAIETTKTAIAQGMVHACSALEGYDRTITAQITTQPERSRLWAPFKERPGFIDQATWNALTKAGRAAIGDAVVPALRTWLKVYRKDYMKNCQETAGIGTQPRGTDYYAHRIKRYTTTTLSAREIHQIGLSQVSRIRREMRTIMDRVKFDGRFQEFQAFLRTDPRFYPQSKEELLQKTALIAKQADGELPKLFGHLPRMPYTIKAIPREIAQGNTTAYYELPAGDGTRPGVYRVNTTELNQRPLYEMEALTLHEAVPGNHLQIAIQQELEDLPNFRRYGGHDAFSEGWGLYAERLGKEMGFYTDPYSDFGRLSYEMWRACRLVVDTGIHVLGWTRQQAIDFMADNTALSETNIAAEVDRYITWPGQALAYKIGEIKIRDLRQLSEDTLGPLFDLRAFHDELLSQGALPLNILETRMRDWIRAQGGILPEPRRQQEERGERRPDRGEQGGRQGGGRGGQGGGQGGGNGPPGQ